MTAPSEESAYEQRIRRDVAEHGCHLGAVPAPGGSALCVFTVGLWTSYRHPEVVMFGLPMAQAEEMLDLLQEDIEGGAKFAHGDRREGLLERYPVAFRALAPGRAAMFAPAVWFHGGADFPMLQLFWPDRLGRFPWDPDAQEACRTNQPRLDQPAGP